MRILLIALFASFLLPGCAPALADRPVPADPPAENVLRFAGTVVRVPIEGGFYGIVGEDGRRYDPVDLPEAFRQDGLPVQVTARRVEGMVGFHMWGARIEVLQIRRR